MTYSCRRAVSGFTVAARIAGSSVASAAAMPSTAIAPRWLVTSHGLIS